MLNCRPFAGRAAVKYTASVCRRGPTHELYSITIQGLAAPGRAAGCLLGLAALLGAVDTFCPIDGKDAVQPSEPTTPYEAGDKKNAKKKSKGRARGNAPCLAWIEPMKPSRAVIVCAHRLGFDLNSWEQFGKRMSVQGLPTYAIDVRGFGSWMKAKGHQKVNFDACLEDVKSTLKAVRLANAGLPIFLIGESMGGAVVLQAMALYLDLLNGLISSVPAGERFQQNKTDVKVALNFFSGSNRQFDIGSQIIKQATTDPELKAEWKGDPLDRLKLSARQRIQFQLFIAYEEIPPLVPGFDRCQAGHRLHRGGDRPGSGNRRSSAGGLEQSKLCRHQPGSPRAPARPAVPLFTPGGCGMPGENYDRWQKEFADWLYVNSRLDLWKSATFKEVSRPVESEHDFQIRLSRRAHEQQAGGGAVEAEVRLAHRLGWRKGCTAPKLPWPVSSKRCRSTRCSRLSWWGLYSTQGHGLRYPFPGYLSCQKRHSSGKRAAGRIQCP